MEIKKRKAYAILGTALAAAAAAVCAAMLLAALAYVLLDSPAHGAVICVSGIAIAVFICPLMARYVRASGARPLGIAVFAVALFLRLAFVLFAESAPISDFELLYNAAQSLASGDVSAFGSEYFQLWGYQIPFALYESLVIALGGGVKARGLLNALWGAVSAFMMFSIARRFAGQGAAFAAGILYAVYPGAILLTPVLTNQHLSLCLFLTGLYLIGRGGLKMCLLGGMALALGNLMRPEALLVILGVLAASFLEYALIPRKPGRILKRLAAIFLGYVSLTLAVRFAVYLSGIAPCGLGNAFPEWKFVLGLDTATGGRYDAAMEYIFSIPDAAGRSAASMEAIRDSLSGCDNLLLFFAEKSASFWGGYEDSWLGTANSLFYPLRLAERAVFIAASLLAFAGCLSRHGRGAEHAVRAIVAANFAAYLLIEVQARYRYFAIPFLLILSAAGIKRIRSLAGRRLLRKAGAAPLRRNRAD